MSKSASLPKLPYDDSDSGRTSKQTTSQAREQQAPTPDWKQEVNQRLAAHRTRRGGAPEASQQLSEESPRTASKRAADAAARVAARYAKAPSYSALLAGEARAVVRAAGVAAEAARNAQAAAQAVLAGLESGPGMLWDQRAPYVEAAPMDAAQPAPPRWQDEPPAASHPPAPHNPWAGAQPRWEEALPVPSASAGRDVWAEMRLHPTPESLASQEYNYLAEPGTATFFESATSSAYKALDRDEYTLDPYDPVGSATVEPVQPIPANLIEFPREIVAPRKARPRLAEGPFYDPASDSTQLNIFEVDVDQLAPPIVVGAPGEDAVAPPEWASIELDNAEPVIETYPPAPPHAQQSYIDGLILQAARAAAFGSQSGTVVHASPAPAPRPYTNSVQQNHYERFAEAHAAREAEVRSAVPAIELMVAPVSDRALAFVVDAALVMLAFLAAAVVVIASTAHPPMGRVALIASTCGLMLFGILYQFLFFSYGEAGTPGMRYARVALCTFDDDNPTREQMRRRIPAFLLAVLPAGLGLAWAMFDGDHLAWHDRLTRTYQRKY